MTWPPTSPAARSHFPRVPRFGSGAVRPGPPRSLTCGRPDVPTRKGLGAGLMLTAMLMHGLWDGRAAIIGNSVFGWIVPLTLAGCSSPVFIWVYDDTEPMEREWMRELMVPEVELGVVTPAELDALAARRSTLGSYIRAQPNPSTAKHVFDAETELAHQIARDDGAETAAVQRARAAAARARAT